MSYILLNLIPFLAYWDSFTLDFCGQLQGLGEHENKGKILIFYCIWEMHAIFLNSI